MAKNSAALEDGQQTSGGTPPLAAEVQPGGHNGESLGGHWVDCRYHLSVQFGGETTRPKA